MAGGGVEVEGLDQWRRDLKETNNPSAYRREFRKEERQIAQKVASGARGRAGGMGGPFAHFAPHITGSSSNAGAAVGLRGSAANATFWGAKGKHGWYGAPRYAGGPPQHPSWVGNAWDVAGPGGPYAINATVRTMSPQIVDWYGDAVSRVTAASFPDKGGESF